MRKTITTVCVVLAFITAVSCMVGCSDMMERLGEISLSIELDTPAVEGASYTLDASRSGTSTSFRVNSITLPRHTLSSLSKGTWNLTVTAFNGDGDQIGIGSQVVDLKEGQIADVTVLVVFGQSAPLSSSFTVSAPERFNSPQGAISGTTTAMEYKLASASDETPYTACTASSTPLAPGTYVIRYAPAHGLTASEGVTVTVPSYQPIQLTISNPTLTATTKVYDGTVALSGSVVAGTLGGVQDGDDVTVEAEGSYDTAQVGSRTITVTYSLSGDDAPNYLKPVDTTHEGTIGKKQLAITAPTVQSSKTYDQSPTVSLLAIGELSGVLAEDDVSVDASAAHLDATVGTDKPVTVIYTLIGEDAANYLKPVDDTAAVGTITKKALTVSGTTAASKVYDGNTSSLLSDPGTLSGVIADDSVSLQGTATFTNNTVGTGKPVIVTYTLAGEDAGNYSAPNEATLYIGTITKKQLTATVEDYSRTYGEANPSFAVEVDGFVNGEDALTAAGYIAPTASSSAIPATDVGTYTITITGGSATNYSFGTSDTGTLTITKKALTVSDTTVASKVYDGNTSATLSSAGTLNGVLAGDSVSLQATATFADKTVGTSKQVTVTYTLSGTDATNYSAPAEATLNNGTITKKALTVSDTAAASKVYDGNTSATLSSAGTLGGLISGDTVTLGGTATFADKTVGTSKPVTVTYTLSGTDANNYSAPEDATYSIGTITKKQLTATVGDYSRVYGADNPTFTVAVDGFVSGENASMAAGYIAPTASSSAIPTTGVGTYPITITGGDATNYSFDTTDTGTLTITKKLLTAFVDDDSRVYGEENPSFSVAVYGFVSGEDASTAAGYIAPTASSSATSTTGVGTYPITITGGSATNYSFDTTDTGTLTINRADMTGSVSITGTAIVGEVLTAVPSLTNTNTPPTYQWNRSGTPINGATSSTYTLTKDDFYYFITVTATASGSNYQGSITSAQTTQVMKAIGLSISGTISAYYPSSPATQTIINLTGFTPLLGGLEAQVAPNGTTFGSYADIEIDSRGRAMIMMTSDVTTTAKVRLRHKETDTAFAGAVKEISVGVQALAIGDYYAGGIVAYFFTAADPGFVSGELHGLIAAKADSTPSHTKWSSIPNKFEIGTSTLIGTGLANTNTIIQKLDEADEVGSYAAQQARSYTGGGFADWFLPSWNELKKLRENRLLIGNFITTTNSSDYMSSSESTQRDYSATLYYHVLPFDRDIGEWVYDKEAGTHIRPVRYF